MKATTYIICSRKGIVGFRKTRPRNLQRDQIALCTSIVVPDSHFGNAVLGAAITIPEPEAKPPQPTVTASPV